MKNENLRAAIWFMALLVLGAWTFFGWLRFPPDNRLALAENPFQNTPGLNEPYWDFLQQVREVLPPDARYTIRASDREDEMLLFMIAAGILDGREGVPSSYFGEPMADGSRAQWVLSYRCELVPPDAKIVATLPDGCICERSAR